MEYRMLNYHLWMCSCGTILGDDVSNCPICGFIREPYIKEKCISKYIRSFFLSESNGKKIHNSGKHKKNANGFHILNPYLNHQNQKFDYNKRILEQS